MLLKGQDQASPYRGLPVKDVNVSHSVVRIAGETIQFYYYNSGVLTIDAGQAAGTLIVGKLKFDNVRNKFGGQQATWRDTSLSFTSTALVTEMECPFTILEAVDNNTTGLQRAQAMTDGMGNGQYCVDYNKGIIYGIKASTQSSATAASYNTSNAALPANLVGEVEFDAIKITYTDGTKAVLDKVEYFTGGASGTLVATVTYTSATLTDTYVRT